MRVLITSLNYEPEETGIGPYSAGLAKWLASTASDTVNVLAAHPHYPAWRISDGYGEWTATDSSAGLRITRLRHWVPRGPNLVLRLVSELSFAARVAFAPWPPCDVVLAVSPSLMASLVTLVRAKAKRRPVLVWVQDLYGRGVAQRRSTARIFGGMIRAAEKLLLRNAAHVVTIHERFSDAVSTDYGVSRSRLSVVRNWSRIEPTSLRDSKSFRDEQRLNDRLVVLHIGAQGQKQGLAEAVPLLKTVGRAIPSVCWVFVGDGSEREKLSEAIAGDDKFRLIGHLGEADFARALAAADIFLLCEAKGSGSAAVPSKLTTYFSSGSPILGILNDDSIAARELEIAGAGIVTSHQPSQIATAVKQLTAAADRKRLSDAGSQFAAVYLDEDHCCDRLRSILTSLAKTPARHGYGA